LSFKLLYISLKTKAVFAVLVAVVVTILKAIALVLIELLIEFVLTLKDVLRLVFVLALAVRSGSTNTVAC
jgi:hypothetical protein